MWLNGSNKTIHPQCSQHIRGYTCVITTATTQIRQLFCGYSHCVDIPKSIQWDFTENQNHLKWEWDHSGCGCFPQWTTWSESHMSCLTCEWNRFHIQAPYSTFPSCHDSVWLAWRSSQLRHAAPAVLAQVAGCRVRVRVRTATSPKNLECTCCSRMTIYREACSACCRQLLFVLLSPPPIISLFSACLILVTITTCISELNPSTPPHTRHVNISENKNTQVLNLFCLCLEWESVSICTSAFSEAFFFGLM